MGLASRQARSSVVAAVMPVRTANSVREEAGELRIRSRSERE